MVCQEDEGLLQLENSSTDFKVACGVRVLQTTECAHVLLLASGGLFRRIHLSRCGVHANANVVCYFHQLTAE